MVLKSLAQLLEENTAKKSVNNIRTKSDVDEYIQYCFNSKDGYKEVKVSKSVAHNVAKLLQSKEYKNPVESLEINGSVDYYMERGLFIQVFKQKAAYIIGAGSDDGE